MASAGGVMGRWKEPSGGQPDVERCRDFGIQATGTKVMTVDLFFCSNNQKAQPKRMCGKSSAVSLITAVCCCFSSTESSKVTPTFRDAMGVKRQNT